VRGLEIGNAAVTRRDAVDLQHRPVRMARSRYDATGRSITLCGDDDPSPPRSANIGISGQHA